MPGDGTDDWQPAEALTSADGLAAYTTNRAAAAGTPDEGHLGPGAVADLAVLNVPLETLLAADERLADVRSLLTEQPAIALSALRVLARRIRACASLVETLSLHDVDRDGRLVHGGYFVSFSER